MIRSRTEHALRRSVTLPVFAALLLTSLSVLEAGDGQDDRTSVTEGRQSTTAWSPYAAVRPSAPPRVEDAEWASNPVDAFVYARLARENLEPAPAVGRRLWIRRVTFDLTGLPPTPEEIDAFLNDRSPDAVAYAKVVDRLLASPHYGEQKARLWLDVVRYADTDGYAIDGERLTLWRYRDYVIRSWNEDKRFDAFAREQIAGDLLPAGDEKSGHEGVIAAGFLRLGPWEADNMVRKDRRQDYLDEITSATGTVFLGLTVGCARCHDHKYDPIPTAEYYAMQAFFAATQRKERPVEFRPEELPPHLQAKKAAVEAERAKRSEALTAFRQSLKEHLAREDGKEKDSVTDEDLKKGLARDKPFTKEQKKKLVSLQTALKDYKAASRFDAVATSVEPSESEKTPRTFVLRGGALTSPGEEVAPKFITALGEVGKGVQKSLAACVDQPRHRRLVLADWIASRENPLTARVLVNRIFGQHFGQGFVATTNNFGGSGSGVSHPQLLDFLACMFLEAGWRSKPIHRLLVLSRAYRSSREHPARARCQEVDPDNRFLWRANRRRLAAEELRDALLSVSGRLNREQGGPGFRAALPVELGRKFPFFEWIPSSEEERMRRSIYHFHRRNMVLPFFEVFDAPIRSEPTDVRGASVVTPQVFSLMNSKFAVERSRDMARRVHRDVGADPIRQVRRLFKLALGRLPDERELAAYLALFAEHLRSYEAEASEVKTNRSGVRAKHGHPDTPRLRALGDLCLVTINTNEFLYLE